ncbi:MAG TPA: hypothetical protein VJV78_04610 [Polyangiales bacterium]|nr:hypothetical protein [Polyangiales bacterium]
MRTLWIAACVLCACSADGEPMRKLPVVTPDAGDASSSSDAHDAAPQEAGEPTATRKDAAAPAADTGSAEDAAKQQPAEPPPSAAAGMGAPPAAAGGTGGTDPGLSPSDPRARWPQTPLDDAGTDDDDAGVPPPPPPRPSCSGKPGAPGNTTRSHGDRQYIVHIPPQADPNAALPVILVFHGAGGKGADMQFATNFDALADMQHAIMVYPDGQAGNAPWNVGRNVCPPGNFVSTGADDLSYIDGMLDDIEHDQCLDRGRVFATGFSMGGYFTNQVGCQLGRDKLRAIAPHSGGTHSGTCPGKPLPVLLLHGDADSLINYRCGTQARDYWLDRNGCSPQYDTWDFMGGQCQFHRGCPADAPVVLCTFFGMDHTWAYPPMYDSSSLLIWAFFSPML